MTSRLLRSGLLAGLLVASHASAAPLDRFWPQVRHDVRRTNHAPAAGNLGEPGVRWRFFLGGGATGARAWDVDLDGRDEVLAVEGGRVTARSWSGQLSWSTPALGAVAIAAIADLDGDGLAEVVVQSANAAHVVASVTGKVVWSSPAGLFPNLGFVGTADFDGNGVTDLALAAAAGAGLSVYATTHFYRFAGTSAPLQVEEFAKTPIPSPDLLTPTSVGQAVLDIDGDGLADLLLPGAQHFYAFSGKTGALLGTSPPLTAVTGSHATVVRVPAPDGGKPLLVFSADDGGSAAYHLRGIHVLQLKGNVLQVLWSYESPDLQADRFHLLPGAVGDLDGDGKLEVLAGHFTGGQWSLEARDLTDGKLLTSVDGQAPWLANTPGQGGPAAIQALRLGADGPVALVTGQTKSADGAAYGPVRLLTWTRAQGFVLLADLGTGALSTATLAPNLTSLDAQVVRPALPLSKPEPGATELVMLRDDDGDLRADRLDVLRVAYTGQVTTTHELAMATPLQPLATVRDGQGARHLALSSKDGRLSVLDAKLTLRNDADGDGLADLRYGGTVGGNTTVAPVHDGDAAPLILAGSGDQLLVLDPALAGPVTAPQVRWTFRSGTGTPRGTFADIDGDGTREVLVRHQPVLQGATLTAFSAKGTPLWFHVQPDGPWSWSTAEGDSFAVADVDGDGADDAVCQYDNLGPLDGTKPFLGVVSGKSGKPLWPQGAPCKLGHTAFAVDVSTKPARLDIPAYTERFTCDATTGAILAHVDGKAVKYGVPMLMDLDGDGGMDHVLGGAGDGIATEEVGGTFQTRWSTADSHLYHTSATLVPAGKDVLVASASQTEPAITVTDARTGQPKWKRVYLGGKAYAPDAAPASSYQTLGLVSAADLTGSGHPTLVFRTAEGWLYAVDALDGTVVWALDWGGTFGDPILADVDGDGLLEVLVSFSDGYLYALDHLALASPPWVRENDGSGPALTEAQDIDAQEDTTALHVNWAQVTGSQGYLVEVLDAGGAVVQPQKDVGAQTSVEIGSLLLQPGGTYRTAVRAYTNVGQDKASSSVALSDGVTIVDVSPPWLDGLLAKPAAFAIPGATAIQATLHDKTRLAGWRVEIAPAGGGAAVWKTKGTLATPVFALAQPWQGVDQGGVAVPAGEYLATVIAVDTAGHEAQGSVALHLCAATPASSDACLPGITADAGPGTGTIHSIRGSHPGDCSATRRGGMWPWSLLFLLAVVRWRRRSA
jgi:outer membrane protein assembly factor BamB